MPHDKRGFMSPTQATYLSKRARNAVRAGLLTAKQFVILEAMLWDIRDRGSDRVIAAYGWLQKRAHACRQSVADAIAAFERLGLLRRIKHKVLVLWNNGGRKWQQLANEYAFRCESGHQTEYPKQVIQILIPEPSVNEARVSQEGLHAVASRRMLALGLGGVP